MSGKVETHVSEEKKNQNKELVKLLNENNTIMLASIKNLPANNFQKIKKSLKEKASVRIIKKRALARAIESSNKPNIKELEKHLKEDIAILTSNVEAFELAHILGENKSPMKAKAGQTADRDIEIEAGITELPAGPAVSELGGLGLQVKVTNGKIEIMQSKVIIKEGGIITEEIASVLAKLDIVPFTIGFVPLIAYDSTSNKVFEELVMDKDELLNNLKTMFSKSRSFAVNLGYISKDIIGLLLAKANSQEVALSKLVKTEEKVEEKKEEPTESKEEKPVESSDSEVNKTESSASDSNKEDNIQKENTEEENK